MKHPNSLVSVYRFRDLVALSVPGSPDTIYISTSEAKKLARALNKAARNIATEPFVGNNLGTLAVVLARTDRFRDL